jgi:ABC-type sulfate transport system permease component
MDKMDIIIPIILFGLSVLVGLFGKNKPIGFFMAFWVSLVFTPIIGIIVTLIYKKPTK